MAQWSVIPANAATPLPKWEAGVGIAAARLADYRGSEHGHAYTLPIPYIIYRGKRLQLDRDQNRFRLFRNNTFSIDWSAAITQPVKSDDSPRRQHMPDLEPSLEWGPQLRAEIDKHWTFLTRLHVVSTHENGRLNDHGIILTPSLAWEIPIGQRLTFGAKLSAPIANGRNHDYYYGVDPEYATQDRPVYHATGGSSGVNAIVTLSERRRHVWYGIFFSQHFLEGSTIEDSPLIDDKTSWSAGFAATWLILQSNELTSPTAETGTQ